MKLAVTGASGFIGTALVRRLKADGHVVMRLVRRQAEQPDEIPWHPESTEVERWELLEGVAGIVNLAGSNLAVGRWTPARKDEIMRSRVESTRALVAIMAHMNHKPRAFVSASAVGYYGDRGEEELTEASGHGEGFLADVCREWEQQARIAESVGIRTVILRCGVALGAGGGVLAALRPLFRAGLGGRLGDGRQWISWIALDDLLGVIGRSLADERLAGPVNAVAPGAARNAEFTAALAHVLGRGTFLPVPAFVLRALRPEMADEMLLASTRVRPQRLLEAGYHFAHPDLTGALRAALGGG
ncbi:MAG TPA: TIGR01777 family oxidoreductase [Opitutaceae bacterium]|nr:TIGR01777 family oxidoreductase [Opitutaceae bacterium]